MGRRKRAFLEDDSDSSEGSDGDDLDERAFEDNDRDAREERSLFEDPYQHKKRRRLGGKDDAIYGIFGEEDDDEEIGKRRGKQEKRLHFTQAPSFVTGEKKNKVVPDEKLEKEDEVDLEEGVVEQEEEEGDDEALVEGSEDEEPDEESPIPEPRIREESEEDQPRMGIGGLGSTNKVTSFGTASLEKIDATRLGTDTPIGANSQAGDTAAFGSSMPHFPSSNMHSRGGIGSRKSGLGAVGHDNSLPSAFGSTPRPQNSFVRNGTGSASSSTPGTPKLSQEERLHFNKLQNTLGARLMSKMGWQPGTGLGLSGEGIVTPVETKLRPKVSMGLAYKGYKEKTAQSKAEAKRRGEIVSEDEDEGVLGQRSTKKSGAQKSQSDAWKKPRKTKVKIEYQTYEQIVQDAGQEAQVAGIGKIYDATSGEMREVSSLVNIASASWTPSTDTTRIPEVRHNIRLIVDATKAELDGLAREAKALHERKKWVGDEDVRLRQKVQKEAELITRLQNIHLIADDIKTQSQLSGGDDLSSLEAFSPHIEKLATEFEKEYDDFRLDEIVVAAIAPLVQRLLAMWKPLEEPYLLVDSFRRWRHALKLSSIEGGSGLEVDVYGTQTSKPKTSSQDLIMTPYESLLWNVWMPKVRSCINNDWSPLDADPAIQLYEAWSNILPPFIRDNMLDQLVLPKVQKAMAEWQPRAGCPALRTIVFPWLPHVGLRMEELLDEAKRKIKSLLRSWLISDGMPEGLIAWKDVFGIRDWDAMMLKYIVPKLGITLREDFRINPRRQDMAPLEHVLPWRLFLPSSVFSQLLELEFFPKWLDVLHIWLIQPEVNFEEVAQWYAFWKDTFPQEVRDLPSVKNGLTRGLQLMNKAVELGPEAASKLPRPDHSVPVEANGSRQGPPKIRATPSRATEITFRSIVEDYAASHDLLFIPTGRAHEKSRMPLFRVSHSVDGRGGVLVFILDDAVWAPDGDDYRAISLEEMVLRANRS